MFVHLPLNRAILKRTYPGWYTLVMKVSEETLTLKDVMKYVGITKRQIDYWVQKGVLLRTEKDPQKWRRFSLLDLFTLAVAYKFQSKGIEIADLPVIRDKFSYRSEYMGDDIFVPKANNADNRMLKNMPS